MYNSQYYTCEQIDQRLLQGYLDDYNTQTGHSLTKEQFLTKLGNVFAKETLIDNNAANIGYFVCDTANGTPAKVITAAGYELFMGGSIKVKFTNRNTALSATLNINGKGDKALYYGGKPVSASNSWDNGEVVEIYYDGTSYYANNVEGNFNDGIFDISAYNLTEGQPTKYATLSEALGTNGNNIPLIFRRGGMQIKYVSTSDNKYVQYRLMTSEWSTIESDWERYNHVTTKNIADGAVIYDKLQAEIKDVVEDITHIENPEFIRVYTDNEGKILWGISPDGNIHFGVGVPPQVAEYITKAIEALDIPSIIESVDAMEDLGMSIIAEQWLKVIIDAEGHIIESLDEDGTYRHHTRHIFDEVSGTFTVMSFKNTRETTIEDNPEYLDILTDSEGHIIEYILPDGTRYIAKLDSPSISALLTKIEEVRSNLQAKIDALSKQKTIVCWGDSLTAGAGSANITNVQPVIDTLIAMGYEDKWSSRSSINYETMLSTLLPDYKVVNCGVGGESTYTIAARQGAEPAFLPNEIVIPASKDEQATIIEGTNVALGSLYKRDARVTPLIQGEGNSVNPVYIEGIECTLKATTVNYQVSRYSLQRTKDGSRPVTIPAGTPIIMSGSKKYRNADCAILWCWQNGGYTDNNDLVTQLKNMISHLPTEKFLIIGLHSGTATSRGEQEQLLEQTFGDKFFNWRRYVSTNALYDWGFTPTEEDESAMAVGSIPPTFLVDSVHLKASGYMILGYKMWERMIQLGYFY